MKKFILFYFSLILVIAGCKSNATDPDSVEPENKLEIPSLFERKGELAKAVEWEKTKQKVEELKARIQAKPEEVKPRLQIATIYITEARITGEHPYYYPAIIKILDGVLAIDSKNFEATILMSSVKMSQHKFQEAKSLAEQAKILNPNNAYVYGILVDANVELGNYEQAIAASDKMQALKPSLEAYSRASYLREIFGDNKGAIEAMKLAVQAGLPGSEPRCWSQNILGQLYMNGNELDKAERQYKEILAIRPSYAFALAGLAKVEEKRKNYETAYKLLDSAAAILPEFSFHEQMADLDVLQARHDKAQNKYIEVRTMLDKDAKSGHSVSLELAKLYIKMNQFDSAEKFALEEYAVRPKSIDVNKELAWIAYKRNNINKAKEYLKVARHTGSKDPELLKRAAMIDKS